MGYDLAFREAYEVCPFGQEAGAVSSDDGTGTPAKWEPLPDSVVKSTGRTMQILEFFDHHQAPSNISQVARALVSSAR